MGFGEKLRKKKITVSVVVATLILLLLASTGVIIYLIEDREDPLDWHYFDSEIDIENVLFSQISSENPDDIVYVTGIAEANLRTPRNYVSGHYIVGSSRAGRNASLGASIWWEHDIYIYRVYNLLTLELERELNVLEILAEYEEVRGSHGLIAETSLIEIDEYLHLAMMLYQRLEDNSLAWSADKKLLININTGEHRVVDLNYSGIIQVNHSRDFEIQQSFFDVEWMSQEPPLDVSYNLFLERNGIYRGDYGGFRVTALSVPSDTIEIALSSNNLPEENERLYTLFPDLEQFRNQDGIGIIIILTGGYWMAEEILSLFMEDGQDISFEGVIMSGDFSIDGEEHEIHSFEDYFRLRDFSEWDEE